MISDPRRGRRARRGWREMAGWDRRGPAGTGKGLGLRLLPLSRPRRLCRGRGRRQRRDRGAARPHVVRHRLRPGDQPRRGEEPARGRHDHGRQLGAEGAGAVWPGAAWSPTTWDDYPILRFDEVPPVDVELIMTQQHEPSTGTGEVSGRPGAGRDRQRRRPRARRKDPRAAVHAGTRGARVAGVGASNFSQREKEGPRAQAWGR